MFARLSKWFDPGKPVRELLVKASQTFTGDTPNPKIDGEHDEFRRLHYDEFMEHEEWGLALEVLVYIGDACAEDGQTVPQEYWNTILEAAILMEMDEMISRCHPRIHSG